MKITITKQKHPFWTHSATDQIWILKHAMQAMSTVQALYTVSHKKSTLRSAKILQYFRYRFSTRRISSLTDLARGVNVMGLFWGETSCLGVQPCAPQNLTRVLSRGCKRYFHWRDSSLVMTRASMKRESVMWRVGDMSTQRNLLWILLI